MSDSNSEQVRALECLRLASDLIQLSKDALKPDLKAHCLRLASVWTDRADQGSADDPAPLNHLVIDVTMDAASIPRAPVILVVEDDPFLRMVMVELINEAGFETLEARDADQAIALLESGCKITVLFTDINMPGTMDGLKLAGVVSDRWPVMGILVASGHVQLQQADLPPDARFLRKPYQVAAMIADLHSLISAAPLTLA